MLYLAGLVVCAKDGLDVDLLVSSSLDGWEEESDLCVRKSHPVKNKTKTEPCWLGREVCQSDPDHSGQAKRQRQTQKHGERQLQRHIHRKTQ